MMSSSSLVPIRGFSPFLYQRARARNFSSFYQVNLRLKNGGTSKSPPPLQQESIKNDEPQPKLYNELNTAYILVYGHPKEEGGPEPSHYMLKPYFLYDQGFLAQHDSKTRKLFEEARKEREAFLGIT